ncbi:morphogenic membrane protein MmpA [Streptomyces exfoliatus]
MTTPLSASARSHGRGLNLVLAGAGLLALGWVCAMSYVLVVWTLT